MFVAKSAWFWLLKTKVRAASALKPEEYSFRFIVTQLSMKTSNNFMIAC